MIDFTKLLATLKRWCVEILVVIAIIVLACLWISSHREAKAFQARATAAEKTLKQAQGTASKGEEALDRAKGLQAKLDASEAQRKALLAKVDQLQAVADQTPVPPKPGTAPTELAGIIWDLKAMGTSPEPLQPNKLAFPGSDGPTLWTWGKESARVPGLEARLDAQGKLADGLRSSLDATTSELSTMAAQRDEFKLSAERFSTAYDGQVKGTDILKVQVGTVTAQRDRARRTRIYVGIGAAALGGWAGWKLHSMLKK